MKPISILLIIILNAVLWNLINSVKNNKEKNELIRVKETSKELTINDEAESSVQKSEGKLKPIANKGTRIRNKGKKRDYDRIYYQNNREKILESRRIYQQNNKEKSLDYIRKYRHKNKEKFKEYERIYRENNREKRREANRKYREKLKNKKGNLKNLDPKIGNIHSNYAGDTPFVNTQNNDVRNKGKLPIVYEESIQHEVENLSNQEEEECNKDETENYVDEQNQLVEEHIRENYMNQIDLNEKYYPLDLNKKPEGNDEDFY